MVTCVAEHVVDDEPDGVVDDLVVDDPDGVVDGTVDGVVVDEPDGVVDGEVDGVGGVVNEVVEEDPVVELPQLLPLQHNSGKSN